MKTILGISYVNRPDLLRLAVNSIKPFWPFAFILDNSDAGEVFNQSEWPIPVKRVEGVAPLSFSESMNYIQHMARLNQCKVCMSMHTDAEAHPGTPEKMLAIVESAFNSNLNWGAAFTHYDTLAAFNMRAVDVVGPWDTTLPQYFADNDYYRRLRLAGYELIETSLGVTHHCGASATIKSDPRRSFINSVTFPLYGEYYRRKWGGGPDKEVYSKPFNQDF